MKDNNYSDDDDDSDVADHNDDNDDGYYDDEEEDKSAFLGQVFSTLFFMLPEGRAYSRRFVCPSIRPDVRLSVRHSFVRSITQILWEISTSNFISR